MAEINVNITNGNNVDVSVDTNQLTQVVINRPASLDLTIEKGAKGEGVASGGTAGQFLIKQSSVPYDTAWQDPDYVQFDTAATASIAFGKLRWNATYNTLGFGIIDGTDECAIGQQMFAYVVNAESVTIQRGQPVYLYRATGNKASVKLAGNTGDATSAKTLGLAAQSIAPNQAGFVITQGVLDKVNTGAFTEGATLYLGATAGTLTSIKPQAPNHLVYIGVVERANAGNGQIYVKPQNGYELDEIHDVQINSPVNGQTIIYDQSTSLWKNANLTAGTGISITNGPSSITISAPDTGTVTSVNASGGSTGMTFTGGPVTTSGTLTLGGTLAVGSGGTGATTASDARTNLGLGTAAVLNAAVANGAATLDAGGTIPLSQIPASLQGGVSYQGSWNASTNSPALASGVGTKGYYYVVSVAGSTNLDGITDWLPGDWAIFNGTVWQKIDNTDAVSSVNGYTGAVVLTASDIGGLGTIATQNANNVAVTGGSINGTTIGATTASTGKFTDLTDTGLTSGRVIYAGTGGNLVDSANLTFDGTNLTAGGIQNTVIGNTTPNAATFTTLTATGQTSLGGAAGSESLRVVTRASADRWLEVDGGSSATGGVYATSSLGSLYLSSNGGQAIRFFTNGKSITEQFRVSHTASAVNYVQVTGAATGSAPVISAQGSDTNVALDLRSKGTSSILMRNAGGGTQFVVTTTGAGTNYLQIASAATTVSPVLSAQGGDTNIDLALTPKGTGLVRFGTRTASADAAITGYIEIKDSGGTVRRLAVIG